MNAATPEERRKLALAGVAARLLKKPPLSMDVLQERRKLARFKLRKQVINHYGGKCVCCGETTFGFLTIDHVNGGGRQHKKLTHGNICHWLRKHGFPDGFQVLCYNCNCAKGMLGSCPHAIKSAS